MSILQASVWLTLLLFVVSVNSFSAKGFATKAGPRNNSCRSPFQHVIGHSRIGAPVRASKDATTITSQTPKRGVRFQWIRKLFSLRLPRLPVKARRYFAALFIAVSIWLNGMNVPVVGGMNDVAVAHAAAPPISIRFTGAEVVARSPSTDSFSSSPDMMSLALQKRQAALMSKQQAVAVQTATMMTPEWAEFLAAFTLSTGVAYAWASRKGGAMAGASSEDDAIDTELELQQQKAPIDEVNTLTQVTNAAKESGGGTKEVLPSDIFFLTLCGLAAAESISLYAPKLVQ